MLTLQKIFLKNPNSPAFWLVLGFIVKGALFLGVVFNHPYHDIAGIWGATWADDDSYLVPIDNFLRHGIYTPDYRMPGYGIVYLLFRLVFAQAGACNALLILQLILASASVYYLALIARNIFKSNAVFYLTFYLFLLCSFSDFFDAYIASESLCTSLLIFNVYFFIRYFQERKNKYLFFAGLLATWVMFIRPVFGGLVVVFSFLILFKKGVRLNNKVKFVLLFLIPFVLCEGSWVSRNFQVHKKITPFNSTGNPFYPGEAATYIEPLFNFVQSWGGLCSGTGKYNDMDWFQYNQKDGPSIIHYDSLPNNIYTSAFNKDSLLRLKVMILALQKPSIDTTTASIYQQELRTKFDKYRFSIEREKPFLYFIKAPLRMLHEMLYGYDAKLYLERGKSVPFFGGLIVAFNYFMYITLLFFGLMGAVWLIIIGIKRSSLIIVIPFIPLYTILIHPFIFRFFASRYLMPAYPFLIICSAYLLYTIYKRCFSQKIKG